MNRAKIFLLALAVTGLVGCADFLLETPQQSLDLDEVGKSAEGLRSLVTGLYDGIQSANIAGGNYNVIPEIMADNAVWTGSFTTYLDFASRQMTAANANTVGWWTSSYRVINIANHVLDVVNQIDDPTLLDAEKDLIRGDAYFVRGMVYFELARVYAKPWNFTPANDHSAVPIRTTVVKSPADLENLPRSTMAQVFTQAENDLLQGVSLLPATRANRRATSHAARGYLMRMEMVKGNYSAAANYAQQIMGGGFVLTPVPSGPFTDLVSRTSIKFSTESIFEIAHSATDNPGVNAGQNAFYASAALGGRGDIRISTAYVTAIGQIITATQQTAITAAGGTATDLRVTTMLTGTTGNTSATRKFTNSLRDNNVLNLRYADVLLTRAEALAEVAADLASVPAEVYTLVNTIRNRAIRVTGGTASNTMIQYTAADFATKADLINAILLERRVELAFEGDRFYTLHRKGLTMRGLAPSDNRVTFPIPQPEVDANPLMTQNPGY